MINFSGTPQRSGTWTWFTLLVASKNLVVQYEEVSDIYLIYGYDLPEVCTCTIWTGTVPASVVSSGYSQAQNDSDKADFEANYKPAANRSVVSKTAMSGSTVARATYSAEAALAGANNKDMFCLLNPSGSGKILRIYEVWATVPSSSGATVIIPFEIRKTSTMTGGTSVTPMKWDSTDENSVVNARHTPTGLTDQGVWYTFVEQINTAQGSTAAHTETIHDGEKTSELKPITLQPGEGLYLKQVANNTSTFRMGALWTEETS